MDATRLNDGRVALTLSYAEAIVLSKLLSGMERDQQWDRTSIRGPGQASVVWD